MIRVVRVKDFGVYRQKIFYRFSIIFFVPILILKKKKNPKVFHSYDIYVVNIPVRKIAILVNMSLRTAIAHPSHPLNMALYTIHYQINYRKKEKNVRKKLTGI